jgi:photosystem II cytochrome c550
MRIGQKRIGQKQMWQKQMWQKQMWQKQMWQKQMWQKQMWQKQMWQSRWLWGMATIVIVGLSLLTATDAAIAAADPYVTQFLKVARDTSAVMSMDKAGTMKEFTYAEFIEGKELFGQNCLSCHVGGTTLSSPAVSLALTALQGATPPLDTVNAIVGFMRHPVSYDGSDENFSCREVTEDWLNQDQVEKMAAFLLRAAQYAKGWGTARF